ncbi:hypothetical protein [Streptantibioticus ferralitis]|uniref:Uncharacterized protein n=1 Tax=Streptantibioticus ferralitis TaxID=236510 RepID=A0ABT5Z9M1_9ACTN|nr:hypothetical protein [Streptantibioticus ferralitis]MDF2260413.1 hypothetical protein [Streptantibioticus ferralitis]
MRYRQGRGRPGVDRLTRVVVHLGSFSHQDVLWASRQGGVHLLARRQLQRWADGATLDDLGLSGRRLLAGARRPAGRGARLGTAGAGGHPDAHVPGSGRRDCFPS